MTDSEGIPLGLWINKRVFKDEVIISDIKDSRISRRRNDILDHDCVKKLFADDFSIYNEVLCFFVNN